MSDNTTRAARCEYRCQYAEDVGMTGHSCAQECLYRDAAGGSPGAETPPLDDYAKQDFNERLASIKRCIPHMADVGGIWPRDVEWLIGQLASQSATISTLQQQLADAVLTARYQSDVARQADEAREKAEQERDAARELVGQTTGMLRSIAQQTERLHPVLIEQDKWLPKLSEMWGILCESASAADATGDRE